MQETVKKNRLANCISVLSIIVSTIYPILFMYFRNIQEARERHLIVIALVFFSFALITSLITALFKKNLHKTAFISNILLTVVFNFEFLTNFFEASFVVYLITSVIAMAAIAAAIICSKLFSDDTVSKLNAIWAATIIGIILLDSIPAMPYMYQRVAVRFKADVSTTEAVSEISEKKTGKLPKPATDSRPNVYLMIFDEYGGYENLEFYYEYDNKEFYEWMEKHGFNVSYSSRNTESISTVTNVPNLLNLDYVVDHEQEQAMYPQYLRNPYIYKLFKSMGYDINTASYTDFLDNSRSTLNYNTRQAYENTVGYYILKNSILVHPYNAFIAPNLNTKNYSSTSNAGANLIEAMEFYKSFSSLDNSTPHLNLGYFECPHVPFSFKSDGTAFTKKELKRKYRSQNYIEYLKWTTSQIENITETILANDPDSIIIVMSDHGSRAETKEDDDSWNNPDYYRQNILNCVYLGSEELDIEGMTGINTFITVLNQEYGFDFEYKYFN